MEKAIWWSAVAMIANVAVWSVIVDIVLITQGYPSITDYLRGSPVAFWVPAICAALAILTLGLHLYAFHHTHGVK